MVDSQELHYCEVLYYRSSTVSMNWPEYVHELALKYATNLGQLLTHFDFCSIDENCSSKGYRYIKRNRRKLEEAMKSTNNKGVHFYCVGEDGDFFEAPMGIGILNEEPMAVGIAERKFKTDFGVFIFESKLDIVTKQNSLFDFCQTILQDVSSMANVRYGLVTVMQGRKYPGMYFLDSACSTYLSEDEDKEVEIWRKESCRFETIVRKIYWGNVISRSHWGNDKAKEKYLLTKLQHECKGNVFWIDDDTIFFCAPFDISQCVTNQSKFRKFQHNIANIFADIGTELLV